MERPRCYEAPGPVDRLDEAHGGDIMMGNMQPPGLGRLFSHSQALMRAKIALQADPSRLRAGPQPQDCSPTILGGFERRIDGFARLEGEYPVGIHGKWGGHETVLPHLGGLDQLDITEPASEAHGIDERVFA